MDITDLRKNDIYTFQSQIKKTEKSVLKRLRSIIYDAKFVDTVQIYFKDGWNYPMLANLRCGAWYSSNFDDSCYYKSSDGHYGQWRFPLNRINLHVVQHVIDTGGCVIIDSTRKGKRYPDSFSRTIPLWASTINHMVFNNISVDDEDLWLTVHTPSWISESETELMSLRIPTFLNEISEDPSIMEQILNMVPYLHKPLRVLWFCPDSCNLNSIDYNNLPFYPIICVSSSKEQGNDTEYIQGAADDHETWSMGLEPDMFWKYKNELLSSDNIEETIQDILKIVDEEKRSEIHSTNHVEMDIDTFGQNFSHIEDTLLYFGSHIQGTGPDIWNFVDSIINLSSESYDNAKDTNYIHLPIIVIP
eukprot:TRINITY_DN2154_c5_g1_i1.p1 TRINITY_DN2154_c5_g1~~TRINITY_DN2154_c5_g1_i1.p1  ORF type:complete len:360 (+),score=63.40 TRINITY_DN2154_c5_g1_i1:158-1237(+)